MLLETITVIMSVSPSTDGIRGLINLVPYTVEMVRNLLLLRSTWSGAPSRCTMCIADHNVRTR